MKMLSYNSKTDKISLEKTLNDKYILYWNDSIQLESESLDWALEEFQFLVSTLQGDNDEQKLYSV